MELRELADIHLRIFGQHSESGNGASTIATNGSNAPNPLLVPPKGHLDFFPKSSVALLAAPGASQTVVQFRVPLGMDGVIKSIGCAPVTGGFVNDSGDIIWRILADGRAVRNFDNIRSVMGESIGQPVDLAVGIPIFSGQLIEFQTQHPQSAALDGVVVVCQFKGYFFPSLGGGAA